MHYWWECRLVRPLWKTIWNFLRKLKVELPFDPAILLLGLYPKSPDVRFIYIIEEGFDRMDADH